MPDRRGVLGGAAYRNRTDDLRITRGTLAACTRSSCTDTAENDIDGTRCNGLSKDPFHEPFHARDPTWSRENDIDIMNSIRRLITRT